MENNKIKQVIVIRKDLNMRKGKMCSMSSHASMGAIFNNSSIKNKEMIIPLTDETIEWFRDKFTKICVSVNTEEELIDIYQKSKDAGLNVSLIKDAGLTEFNGIPTLTCLAIGPHSAEKIDPITGHLKLL